MNLESALRQGGVRLSLSRREGRIKSLFILAQAAVTETTAPELKKTMDLVRKFCFSHGLLGEKTASADDVGIQFPDASVLGKADRVRLRSSRITATVQTIGSGIIALSSLPSIFFGHGGITLVQALTFPPTIFFEIGRSIVISDIGLSNVVSVRGPLFNVSGGRTLIATKVVLKP